jgi:hypothetical protein
MTPEPGVFDQKTQGVDAGRIIEYENWQDLLYNFQD